MKYLRNASRVSGSLFLLFGIWVALMASQFKSISKNQIGPGKYPITLALALSFLSIILIVLGNKTERKSNDEAGEKTGVLRQYELFVTITAIIAYISVFKIVGFFISTILLLFGLSMYYGREKWREIWKKSVIYSVSFTILLYLIFKTALHVLLPTLWL